MRQKTLSKFCNTVLFQLLKEKWLSIQNHIVGVHSWTSCDKFHKCEHDPVRKEEEDSCLLVAGSKAHKTLISVISKPKLLDDLKQMTKFKHTGNI